MIMKKLFLIALATALFIPQAQARLGSSPQEFFTKLDDSGETEKFIKGTIRLNYPNCSDEEFELTWTEGKLPTNLTGPVIYNSINSVINIIRLLAYTSKSEKLIQFAGGLSLAKTLGTSAYGVAIARNKVGATILNAISSCPEIRSALCQLQKAQKLAQMNQTNNEKTIKELKNRVRTLIILQALSLLGYLFFTKEGFTTAGLPVGCTAVILTLVATIKEWNLVSDLQEATTKK